MKKLFNLSWLNMIMAIGFLIISFVDLVIGERSEFYLDLIIVFINVAFVILIGIGDIIERLDEINKKLDKENME